jgi:hypothetical protein
MTKWQKDLVAKKWTREMIFRYFERRFFCHFIFLPFSWLRPKAALGNPWSLIFDFEYGNASRSANP